MWTTTGSELSALAQRRVVKRMATKNVTEKITDELRPEYDLSKLTGAVTGKYYKRATAGTTLVSLDADVAEAFPDSQTVNDVLRAVVKIARAQTSSARGRKKDHVAPSARKKSSGRRK